MSRSKVITALYATVFGRRIKRRDCFRAPPPSVLVNREGAERALISSAKGTPATLSVFQPGLRLDASAGM